MGRGLDWSLIPVPMAAIAGPELTILAENAAFVRATGRTAKDKSLRDAFSEQAADWALFELVRRVATTREPGTVDECPLRGFGAESSHASTPSHFKFECAPWPDEAAPDRVVLVAIDVTRQVLASRAKDEFLAMLGHELRNPLAPILTALSMMRLRADESLLREREVIERQVQHLVRLVDDLLDVSRITSGKVELRCEHIELSEVVTRAIELSSPAIEEQRHHLLVDLPRTGLLVHADAARLAQVVANLLTNAAKYMERRGHIHVRGGREGSSVVLRVRDSGIGLPSGMAGDVFSPFYQAPQALDRSRGGLGLGLTIVRSFVELHGGTVEAHSEGLGCGSEFVVRLPPAGSDTASEARPASSSQLRAGRVKRVPCRVLIVDDNQDAAELLTQSLSWLGHSVAVCHDGPAALALARAFKPDVALLDIGLPVMDGYELARLIRQESAISGTKLLAVTGYGQDSDRELTRAAGFDRHLVKPVDLSVLADTIDDVRGEAS